MSVMRSSMRSARLTQKIGEVEGKVAQESLAGRPRLQPL
jgi:hypothetical protein